MPLETENALRKDAVNPISASESVCSAATGVPLRSVF